ncbi:hypothetical protein IEQ34_004938 [Dendrobium chrysotoxum]|uniref:Uncharacterized protein n=1 Tax=Dendrobium chrysotoxum TaxID=161865 RepID=A0AAV7GSH4_DENCH|nr:hypothetical protein IEQ34_004938 [Dendrobium chrysotoxum]
MTGDHHPPIDPMTKGDSRPAAQNDVKVPKRSDQACLPPPGYMTISESSLQARLRFPPPLELIDISTTCEGLTEKWGRMKDLPVPLYIEEEDIRRILNIPNVEHLLFKIHYLTKYIEEEFLFKVMLLIQARKSEAKMLKKSSKVQEPPAPSSKVLSKQKSNDPQALLKKKKLERISISINQVPPYSSSAKLHVPGDVLKHQCLGRRKTDDLHKAKVKIDGLTTSQASEDLSLDLDGAEIESELRMAFSSDDESVDVE